MKKPDLKSIFISIAHAIAVYGCFAVIALITVVSFKLEVSEQRYYLIYGELSENEISLYCALAVCIILFFVIFAFSYWNFTERIKYLSYKPKEFKYSLEIKNVILSFDFVAEFVVCMVLTAIFSGSLFLADIGKILFMNKSVGLLKNICIVLIISTVQIAGGIFHRVNARKTWFNTRYSEEKSPVFAVIKSIIYVIVLALFFVFVWVYVPVIPKNFPIILMISQIILPIFLVPIVIIALIQYIRAAAERSAFIKNLKITCKEENIDVPKIKNKFSFVFLRRKGSNFTLEVNEKKYDCKFIASRKKGVSIILDDDGNGLYVHTFSVAGAVLGQYHTRFKYGFESGNIKILIVCPRPQEISAADGTGLHQVDSGDTIGDYKLFSADGFIRSIELNTLEK